MGFPFTFFSLFLPTFSVVVFFFVGNLVLIVLFVFFCYLFVVFEKGSGKKQVCFPLA